MHIHNFSNEPSILQSFLSEIRDQSIQKDRMRFRRNIERIGEILGYELSKILSYKPQITQTPLGTSDHLSLSSKIVICSILRAGLPFHNGLLNYFDQAENAFISAYRQHHKNSKDFDIKLDYISCPSLENKTLILADPMLASGQSIVKAFKALTDFGQPTSVHLVSAIGAKPGVDYVRRHLNSDTHLWIAAIDEELNHKGYIVPGLGDAGDLAYGGKLQQ